MNFQLILQPHFKIIGLFYELMISIAFPEQPLFHFKAPKQSAGSEGIGSVPNSPPGIERSSQDPLLKHQTSLVNPSAENTQDKQTQHALYISPVASNRHEVEPQKPGTHEIHFRQPEEGDAERAMKQVEEHGKEIMDEIKKREENLGKGVEEELRRREEKFYGTDKEQEKLT